MYYTYMIRCKGNSLYTGIAKDLEKRFNEHFLKDEKGAKYTKSHNVIKIEAAWISSNRSQASKLEYNIKKLTKLQKEELIVDDNKLKLFLDEKIDSTLYKKATC